ncbi:alanyl-tRNA editing protein [Candidatus Woesearchaeota archaeon]|nr:alanyl-tRNA editing protein [Candidatus Woesearchaeota archaeon]
MQNALYMDDSYLKEFEAAVVSVKDGKFVVLDRTAFFPQGGGVECDHGTMKRKSDGEEFKVVFAGKFEGSISHEVDHEGLKEGDAVHCTVDWDRRYNLMRCHTGIHVLCGVFSQEHKLLVTGNQLSTDKCRVDLNMEQLDIELVKKCFGKANEIILQDLPVEVYYKSREEAEKDPSLFKLAIGFPHDIDTLRIVDIKGFDAQADGGCHVKTLSEIGTMEFVRAENKGKQNRRVYFTVN